MQQRDELKIYFEPRKALAWQVFVSDRDAERASGYAGQVRSMFAHLGKERFSHLHTTFDWVFFFRDRKDLAMALLVSELPVVRMYDRQLDSLTD